MGRIDVEQHRDDDAIDVIVPVHNNHADANRLLASLARARTEETFTLTVVDDASTDSTPLVLPVAAGWLRQVSVIRNPRNLGFAASVNVAMAESRRDVVLLNSDTLVFDGWLDRLRHAAASDTRIATVTPLSNAATILSYPVALHDMQGDLETDWACIDGFCARLGSAPLEIPTGVGFCMLIRRACLDAVGAFDAETFGAGYGEECDFCRRAVAGGWINVAAPDVFVWHRGQGSFGQRGQDLRRRAQRLLADRHPDYHRAVAAFIRRDPLYPLRRRLDALRVVADRRTTRLFAGPPDRIVSSAAVKVMSLRREGPPWNRMWKPVVDGFGPLPNLPGLSRTPQFEDLAALLRETAVSEILIPPYRALPGTFVKRLVVVASALGIECRSMTETVVPSRYTRRLGRPAAGR